MLHFCSGRRNSLFNSLNDTEVRAPNVQTCKENSLPWVSIAPLPTSIFGDRNNGFTWGSYFKKSLKKKFVIQLAYFALTPLPLQVISLWKQGGGEELDFLNDHIDFIKKKGYLCFSTNLLKIILSSAVIIKNCKNAFFDVFLATNLGKAAPTFYWTEKSSYTT